MSIQLLRQFLLTCFIINYSLLIIWFLIIVFAREWFYGLSRRWFHVSNEQIELANYVLISLYKLGILLFNVIPWIALCLIG